MLPLDRSMRLSKQMEGKQCCAASARQIKPCIIIDGVFLTETLPCGEHKVHGIVQFFLVGAHAILEVTLFVRIFFWMTVLLNLKSS